MKKNLFFAVAMMAALFVNGQEQPVSDSTKTWSITGQNTVMLN